MPAAETLRELCRRELTGRGRRLGLDKLRADVAVSVSRGPPLLARASGDSARPISQYDDVTAASTLPGGSGCNRRRAAGVQAV